MLQIKFYPLYFLLNEPPLTGGGNICVKVVQKINGIYVMRTRDDYLELGREEPVGRSIGSIR